MHPVLQRADGFADLLELDDHGTPYRFASIFEEGGWWARRRSRKKLKLLRRIDEALRDLLEEDEEVLFLTFGADASGLEAYFLGWALYALYRRAVVVTDRRLLFLQIGLRMKPGALRSQVRHSAVRKVQKTLLGRTRLELQDGGTVKLRNVPRRDGTRIAELVEKLRTSTRGRIPFAESLEELCPHCYAAVEGRPARCSECGGTFRSARVAGGLSLLFPGFGDFYLGHRGFALFEMLGAALAWLVVGGFGYLAAAGGSEVPVAALLVLAGLVFVFVHGFDAFVTWYMGRKGIHPGEPGEPDRARRKTVRAGSAA